MSFNTFQTFKFGSNPLGKWDQNGLPDFVNYKSGGKFDSFALKKDKTCYSMVVMFWFVWIIQKNLRVKRFSKLLNSFWNETKPNCQN